MGGNMQRSSAVEAQRVGDPGDAPTTGTGAKPQIGILVNGTVTEDQLQALLDLSAILSSRGFQVVDLSAVQDLFGDDALRDRSAHCRGVVYAYPEIRRLAPNMRDWLRGCSVVAIISDLVPGGTDTRRFFTWEPEQIIQAANWLVDVTAAPEWGPEQELEQPEPVLCVVQPGEREPTRAYPDDAGFDLYVAEDVVAPPGEWTDIPTGVSVQLPNWTWGMITGRSSTLRKRGLLVPVAVIDAGWRGALFAGVWNLTQKPVQIRKGERLAQLIIIDNTTRLTQMQVVDQLEPHPRGLNGFGSSGL